MKEMTATANAREQSSAVQGPSSCCGSTTSTSVMPSPGVSGFFRRYLGGRRGWILLAIAVLGVGAFLNWGWLVAAGIAPLLIAFAPCAAMCALGLCMNKMGGKSCSTKSNASDQKAETVPPSAQSAEATPPPMTAPLKAKEAN